MKYELQTIPVWRAFEAQPECALCTLEHESEERNVTFFLGASIMAPEMRVELNAHGFCPRHFHRLARGEGKLGYSLALNTHLETLRGRFEEVEKRIERGGRAAAKQAAAYSGEIERQIDDCLMCDRMRANMSNFTYTIAKLYQDDAEFRAVLGASKGFCLRHFARLLAMGAEVVPTALLSEWHTALFDLERRNVDTIRQDLEAFSWQFDYQTEKKTPESARDAIPRAVARLAGYGPGYSLGA